MNMYHPILNCCGWQRQHVPRVAVWRAVVSRPWIGLLVALVCVFVVSSSAQASIGQELIKAIGRYLAKETGQEVSEQTLQQVTKQVGEELIERAAQKVVREGGEKALVEVGQLVSIHGPDIVRALDNAPDALPLLKLMQDLPADEIGKAASRLAAGRTGRELAVLGTEVGAVALRAEAKHPGVGLRFIQALGRDGAELSLKLTPDQALQIGRHVDDIAQLPAAQKSQLLGMVSANADRFATFVGRFVEKYPGRVLFTLAGTPIILANSSAIFGEGEVVFDPDGNVLRDKHGEIVRQQTGLVPGIVEATGEVVLGPTRMALYSLVVIGLIAISAIVGFKVWKYYHMDRMDLEIARIAAGQAKSAAERNADRPGE